MPDYSKGQIYKICDIGFNQCYIGSSVEKLYNRMAKHRYEYKKYQEGKTTNYCYVYRLFDSYGVNNCKIYWIEDYPCNSKKELEAREGYYQQNTDCVNKQIAGRSKEQWTETTKKNSKYKQKKGMKKIKKQSMKKGEKDINIAKKKNNNNRNYINYKKLLVNVVQLFKSTKKRPFQDRQAPTIPTKSNQPTRINHPIIFLI